MLYALLVDNKEEALDTIHGVEWRGVVQDMDNWLRSQIKYQELSDDMHSAFLKAREELNSITNSRSLTIFD